MPLKLNFECSPEMRKYFTDLKMKADHCYELARTARAKGFDPDLEVEPIMTEDLAARVEGLVGPPGIAERIRKLSKEIPNREILSLTVAREIVKDMRVKGKREAADQAVRTGLAILTEAVLVAPIEGIARIDIEKNPDGTEFLSIYFSGPIRSAGGTGQAMSVLIGDVVRRELGLDRFKPIDGEIERMKEEIPLYKRSQHLQYLPSATEIDSIMRSCPVCVDGESTEDEEVSGYRNLPRIKSARLRGGACLVIAEGLCLKASKIQKNVKKMGIEGWEFIDEIASKGVKKDTVDEPKKLDNSLKGSPETPLSIVGSNSEHLVLAECPIEEPVCEPKIKSNPKYMRDSLAGRPVFAAPSQKGGFRFRYGRARTTGLAALALNPATMYVLGEFIAIGTQMKIERPGKAGVATPCDQVEGPIVLLKSGELTQINSVAMARQLKKEILDFIDLGEILIPFGEFVENNHLLVPGAYDINRWRLDLEYGLSQSSLDRERLENYKRFMKTTPTAHEAFDVAKELDIPLHPSYNLFWHDITLQQLNTLRGYIEANGNYNSSSSTLELPANKDFKNILHELGALHNFDKVENKIILTDYSLPLIRCCGLDDDLKKINDVEIGSQAPNGDVLNSIMKFSGITIMRRAPTRIGASMGRPEKAKERMMKPPVHLLFPLGNSGGNQRLVKNAMENNKITIEASIRLCNKCGKQSILTFCECGGHTELRKTGGMKSTNDYSNSTVQKQQIPIKQMVYRAQKNVNEPQLPDIKAVIGLISENKTPEPIEKGILRAKHDVFVFKDGTIRFDMTDVPLTHFKPKEIGTSIEKLHEMGYTHDHNHKPLTTPEQIVELKVQDIIPSKNAGKYLLKVSKFIDDMLTKFYHMDPYYNANDPQDIIGHLVMGLSPHTSGAVLGRIIGYTRARVGYAHPFFHAAKRRNCDGDEDCVMLMMDGLINFSKSYLPGSRGGFMDAPLVLMTYINPNEIDKEAQNVDILSQYPRDFYIAADKYTSPKDLEEMIETVSHRIGTPGQFENFGFMFDTDDINAGPTNSAYTTLGTMEEKLEAQLELATHIRAVEEGMVAAKIIESHFLPDMIGNLRTFSKQKFRCPKCRAKYRRLPLKEVCTNRKPDGNMCANKLIMTVHEGSVKKYLEISKDIAERYNVPKYTHQRILLTEKAINSTFENDKVKKSTLDQFV